MITTSLRTGQVLRTLLIDAALVAGACLIPTVSHLTAWPLYRLNPMLALLLVAMATGRDWRNGLVMALLLPAVSSLVVGMPTAGVMVCMMAELAVVALLFGRLEGRIGALPALLAAVAVAKGVYYALKALIVAPAVLVGTDWTVQLLSMLLWAGLFSLLYKRMQ